MLSAEYHACGVAPRLVSRGQIDPDNAKYQAAVNVHISGITRRTGLLLLFLLKEGNFLTAAVVITAVLLALLPLILLTGVACWVYYQKAVKGSDEKLAGFINTLLMIFDLVYGQIVVLAVMCVNFSTIYRVYKLLAAVVVRQVKMTASIACVPCMDPKPQTAFRVQGLGVQFYLSDVSLIAHSCSRTDIPEGMCLQVNSSIKDMDRKMTGLANTVLAPAFLLAPRFPAVMTFLSNTVLANTVELTSQACVCRSTGWS